MSWFRRFLPAIAIVKQIAEGEAETEEITL